MEFSNRNIQSPAAVPGAPGGVAGAPSSGKRHKSDDGKWGRVAFMVMVAAVVLLLGAGIFLATTSNNTDAEGKYVDRSKLQAVFLNTGQVYFGNVKLVNSKYFILKNIYYLQTSSNGSSTTATNANTSVSLVKLGCELHEPLDQMVINRDQVTFWENLSDNGQVAQAVTKFEKQNPNGQKCTDQQNAAGTTSGSSAQPAGSSSSTPTTTTTTPTTTNTTKP